MINKEQEIKNRETLIENIKSSGVKTGETDYLVEKLTEEIQQLKKLKVPQTKEELLKELRKVKSQDWICVYQEGAYGGSDDLIRNGLLQSLNYDVPYVHGGSSGDGETFYIVVYFKDYDCCIRVDGYYHSYEGMSLDGTPYFVTPRKKTITTYEP